MMSQASGLESLSELVRTSTISGVARRVLLLRTDDLPPSLSKPEQLKRAGHAVAPLEGADRSQRYDLPGGRIVMCWKGESAKLVEQTMDGLDRILRENPIDAPSLQTLAQLFSLPGEGEALLSAASAGLEVPSNEPVPASVEETEPVAAQLQPLLPAELDRLEQSLAGTDISRFARRRPVSYFNGQNAQLAWEERTLSIPELIDTVAPGRDARSDVWLFRRLTRVLDRRMLSILSEPQELRTAGPFSITLNVASVLSPEFLRFDASLPLGLRSRVVISFLPADIASDAAAFAFARNFARGRSYRICLRAVSNALLPTLDLAALDLDFVQLIWSTDLATLPALPSSGKTRWILGQPLTSDGIKWGVDQGIALFTMKPTV
ncbi:MAG: hypothetical protein ACRYF2_01435 [Janthinobacterium lividum]